MKKLLFLATLLLNMTAVMAQNSEGYIEVSNAQELKAAIQANNSAKIQLTDNIEAPDLRKICGTFKGAITGKHKIYDANLNDSIDAMYCIDGGRDKGGKTTWLFDKVDGAKFDGICFLNFRVDYDGSNVGLIAREAVNSTFSNLTFDNVSLFAENDNAGVIAGIATGCQFEYVNTKFSDVTVDGCCAGGLVGKTNNCRFMTCTIALTSASFADGSGGDASVGGIVGISVHDEFMQCLNSGLVGGLADEIGGIAGRSENSKFISCNNDYAVLFCDESGDSSDTVYFRDLVKKTREKIMAMTIDEKNLFHSEVVQKMFTYGVQVVPAAVIGVLAYYAINSLLLQTNLVETLSVGAVAMEDGFAAVSMISCVMASAIAIVVAVTITAIMLSIDYDYVGGICGKAEYCAFESCTNNAKLYSDDDFCGGIVGYAWECTINNCLNTGSLSNDGANSLGSIVGCCRHYTKVTNCVSTRDKPIMGQTSSGTNSSNDVSEETGNNYRLKNDDNSNIHKSYEMQVDNVKLADGTVAIWLNNGAYNRENGIRPWRQNLSGELDDCPVLDAAHNEVLPKDLPHIAIKTEDDLRAFAQKVNDGEQFCNAVLYNNIEMTPDRQWTPIGTKDHRWRGVFDGQGYTISGLKCSVESNNSEEGAGLFGTVDVHADIRNIIIDSSCEIENNSATGAGGIVGTVRNNSRGWGNIVIRGCGNKGNIKGYQHVGGILGRVINDNEDSKVQVAVDSCYHEGSVMADGYSGLLCGYMQDYGVVTNCWSSGSLKQSGNNRVFSMNNPSGEAEYFVGYDQRLTIDSCYDNQSNVDWFDLVVEKQTQKGVTKYDVTAIYLNDKDNSFSNTSDLQVREIRYTRTFNNTNCQALYIPFELDYKDWCDDFDVYDLILFHEYDRNDDGKIDEYALEAKKITSGHTQANRPYIIKAKTKGEKTFIKNNAKLYAAKSNTIDCSTTMTKYNFIGTYEKIKNMKTAGYYAMSSGMLCPARSDAAELGAYRWYLVKEQRDGSGSSNAPQIRVFVSGEDEGATGIDSYSTMDFSNSRTEIYTISGQKVNSNNMPAGVYIKNGKKFIKK